MGKTRDKTMANPQKITIDEIKDATKKILQRYHKNPNINEWYNDEDYDDDEEEATPWQKYVSNYDNDPQCPFNRFRDGVDDVHDLLQWCFENEFLFYASGRWYAANSLSRQCHIMAEIADDPSVHATHEIDEDIELSLGNRMSDYSQYAVLQVRPSDGDVYYILYEE